MDLKNMPKCRLEARAKLISTDALKRCDEAVHYLKNHYSKSQELERALAFVDFDLQDAMRADFESLGRVWLFPGGEASDELSECLNRALDATYKSARDNMRRALELMLVGAYFSHSHKSPAEAQSWLKSERHTPGFTKAVEAMCKLPRFDHFHQDHNWKESLCELYWELCDTIHTKGEKHSLRHIQPIHLMVNSVRVPEFDKQALTATIDLFLKTVTHIAIIVAAYNPILLVGLPLLEKFADNPPLSGFFDKEQSTQLWNLIPSDYHASLRHIVNTDDEVISAVNWVESLPDIF